MLDDFEREVFDLGGSVSLSEMQNAANRTYIKKLSLNKDGTGTIEYRNPFGAQTAECTWTESDGELRISVGGRTQFVFTGDRSGMTYEIKETFTLDSGFTITSTAYTLKYKKN